jgi:hypothetical protein
VNFNHPELPTGFFENLHDRLRHKGKAMPRTLGHARAPSGPPYWPPVLQNEAAELIAELAM